ncbi:MAG: chemotaxis-specific protein-glutamate methyltransferase CheB [Polyangiaceae bacterium]
MTTESRFRVLVVDDSAFNRRSISDILSSDPEVEVVGKAADGDEALRLVSMLKPDAITLDLEMPRMDGFTFLRILMSVNATPVIIVSSYSQKENVFKALELGALDFVAKPDRFADSEMHRIRGELLQKIRVAKNMRPGVLAMRKVAEMAAPKPAPTTPTTYVEPRYVIAIASSTGGPSALMEAFSKIPERPRAAVIIAQHMPDKFTRTFAERLDRRSPMRVTEAQEGDIVTAGRAFVCPGKRCVELERTRAGELRLRVVMPEPADRYSPSADRLFFSCARIAGSKSVGVVLTGMGDDGVQGARAIVQVGGTVVAESAATAVVYGMPGAAVRAGVVSRSMAIQEIAEWLAAVCL